MSILSKSYDQLIVHGVNVERLLTKTVWTEQWLIFVLRMDYSLKMLLDFVYGAVDIKNDFKEV